MMRVQEPELDQLFPYAGRTAGMAKGAIKPCRATLRLQTAENRKQQDVPYANQKTLVAEHAFSGCQRFRR